MNKTEPVRGREELRYFRSSVLREFDTFGRPTFDSFLIPESGTAVVLNFQTSVLPTSRARVVPCSETSGLSKAVRS